MCRKVDESIDHNVSGCSKLAQKEYMRRHDNLWKIVHWKLARKCNFEAGDKWYDHEPESGCNACGLIWVMFVDQTFEQTNFE